MDVIPPLVADSEPPILVATGQRPLDRPACLAQAALVVDPLLRQDRPDTQPSQPLSVRLGVIRLVPLCTFRDFIYCYAARLSRRSAATWISPSVIPPRRTARIS